MKPTYRNYFEKLKDPLWKATRRRILESLDFTCQHCGVKSKSIHVHHTYYSSRSDPWDYEDASLMALCKKCHEGREQLEEEIRRQLGRLPYDDLRGVLDIVSAIIQAKGK